ncbi:hypothetical protein GCM10028813_25070 [Ramlibacter alkalitolerans]
MQQPHAAAAVARHLQRGDQGTVRRVAAVDGDEDALVHENLLGCEAVPEARGTIASVEHPQIGRVAGMRTPVAQVEAAGTRPDACGRGGMEPPGAPFKFAGRYPRLAT